MGAVFRYVFIWQRHSAFYIGCLVIVMVLLASFNCVTKSNEAETPAEERVAHAQRLKTKSFTRFIYSYFYNYRHPSFGKIKFGNWALIDPEKSR